MGAAMSPEAGSPAPLSRAVRVVIVDDQPFFRDAAREVVEALPGFEAVGEAASGSEAVDVVSELHPDLVLLDVRMPGMDGIEASGRIRAEHPETIVILISVEDVAGLPSSAQRCGAAALVRKADFGPSLLRELWKLHGPRAN